MTQLNGTKKNEAKVRERNELTELKKELLYLMMQAELGDEDKLRLLGQILCKSLMESNSKTMIMLLAKFTVSTITSAIQSLENGDDKSDR